MSVDRARLAAERSLNVSHLNVRWCDVAAKQTPNATDSENVFFFWEFCLQFHFWLENLVHANIENLKENEKITFNKRLTLALVETCQLTFIFFSHCCRCCVCYLDSVMANEFHLRDINTHASYLLHLFAINCRPLNNFRILKHKRLQAAISNHLWFRPNKMPDSKCILTTTTAQIKDCVFLQIILKIKISFQISIVCSLAITIKCFLVTRLPHP